MDIFTKIQSTHDKWWEEWHSVNEGERYSIHLEKLCYYCLNCERGVSSKDSPTRRGSISIVRFFDDKVYGNPNVFGTCRLCHDCLPQFVEAQINKYYEISTLTHSRIF
jgi:hypothetical protein